MMTDEIVVIDPEYKLGIIPAKTPHDVIVQATKIAKELAKIIRDNKLANKIQGREFVRVEGWTTMGAMLGVLPREIPEQGKRFEDGSYRGVVELIRISDGAVIGRASALVGMDEKDNRGNLTWGSRPEYARKSMAITRATGKAYRLGFSWIMTLAGYEATPAEEIIPGTFKDAPTSQTKPAPKKSPPNGDRPYKPEVLKQHLTEWAKMYKAPCTDDHRKMLASVLNTVFEGDEESRHELCNHLTGHASTKDIPDAYVQAMLKTWAEISGWNQPPSEVMIQESHSLLTYLRKEAGQQELIKEE